MKWDPFGPPGWIFEKNETIFRVTYTDVNNMEHEAFCKTSLSGGVYYGLDTIKGPAENADTSAVRPDPEFSQSPAEAVPSQAEVPFVAHSATGSEENLQEENRRLRLEVEHLRRRLDELEGSRDGRPPVEEA
ncbi:MAG: hypothetical protein LIP77_09940 [Planctomycetes bacterium]|nr:hypothetical protein [Planctomycetota bacterium]